MAKKKKLKQTKKYYEALNHYQSEVQKLKTEQATILAPTKQAIGLEIKRHPFATIGILFVLFSISFTMTTPYFDTDSLIQWYIRLPIALLLTFISSLLVAIVITKGQKEIYQDLEEEKIEQVYDLYQTLNHQYDKMKQEQMLNVDFSSSQQNTEPEKKKIFQKFKKEGADKHAEKIK